MKTNIYILVNGRSLCIRRVLTTLFRANFISFFTVLILFHPFCLSSAWKLIFYTMYFFLLNTIGYIIAITVQIQRCLSHY
jgi:fatty-acid desaturase